jgi:hypothetical protein
MHPLGRSKMLPQLTEGRQAEVTTPSPRRSCMPWRASNSPWPEAQPRDGVRARSAAQARAHSSTWCWPYGPASACGQRSRLAAWRGLCRCCRDGSASPSAVLGGSDGRANSWPDPRSRIGCAPNTTPCSWSPSSQRHLVGCSTPIQDLMVDFAGRNAPMSRSVQTTTTRHPRARMPTRSVGHAR